MQSYSSVLGSLFKMDPRNWIWGILVTVVPFLLTSVAQPSLTLLTLANTHKNKLQCSLSLSHTHTHTHKLTMNRRNIPHIRKFELTHTQTHTHKHTHSSTHTRTHALTPNVSFSFFTVGFIWANILFGDGGIDFVHSNRSHGWRNWMNRKKKNRAVEIILEDNEACQKTCRRYF